MAPGRPTLLDCNCRTVGAFLRNVARRHILTTDAMNRRLYVVTWTAASEW